jgi:hypothetical protein
MKFLDKPSPLPATPLGLRPGDFPLGSVESRAAARGLLHEHLSADQENSMRVVTENIGKSVTLETSTCIRYPCADIQNPGRSSIVEIVDLDGSHLTEAQSRKIERWIRKVPIDGKKHSFAGDGL